MGDLRVEFNKNPGYLIIKVNKGRYTVSGVDMGGLRVKFNKNPDHSIITRIKFNKNPGHSIIKV